jgi:hypothetical protein
VRSIEVGILLEAASLRLDYILTGDLAALLLPASLPEAWRGAPLWEHSCFEAFFAVPQGQPGEGCYTEYNFAPWGGWAAYGFTGYRSGQGLVTGVDPALTARTGPDSFALSAILPYADKLPVRVGLSAIVEDRHGTKSYWALAHPPGDPDFHHPDCFALELPPLV